MPARPAPLGAHVSAAGGLARALSRATALGAQAMQVFVANPRGWAPPAPDPDGDAAFAAACRLAVFVHAPYLINFGSPSTDTLTRSGAALEFALRRGAAIGARGVVVHAGSAVLGHRRADALAQTRDAVLRVLDAVPDGPRLLIEPTAGGGGALASDADSLAEYLEGFAADDRVGVCLDTCHLHAAGHDLSTPARFAATLRAFARVSGRGRIGVIHVNDSRDPVGSRRDRHAGIGSGTIGREPFAALFTTPAVRRVPMIVESPDTEHAADLATLEKLRDCAKPATRRRPNVREGGR